MAETESDSECSTAVVVDASAMLSLILSESSGPPIESCIRSVLSMNGQLLVPSLFWYEVINGLISAVKRSRIQKEELTAIEVDITALPISTDIIPPAFIRQRIRELSIDQNLTGYDASYLELANRYQLKLITLDEHLLSLRKIYPNITDLRD